MCDMSITAIQTSYAGCRFRSRLEARWAVFFDHLGVKWRYEPEGFQLPSGPYLPDFHLPGLNVWYEVKGGDPTAVEVRLAEDLAEATELPVLIAAGDIPLPRGDVDGYSVYYGLNCGDTNYCWCICPYCPQVGLEFCGRAERVNCPHLRRADDEVYTADDPRIMAAYRAARSARFEHGETPSVGVGRGR